MSEIRDFIFSEPLFDTHDHQMGYDQQWDGKQFDEFLGYARADLATAGIPYDRENRYKIFEVWPFVRTTGYGQAVEIGVKALFDMKYTASQADEITMAIQSFVKAKSPETIYRELYKFANIKWVVNDRGIGDITPLDYFKGDNYPDFFKFAHRSGRDQILLVTDKSQITEFEKAMDWSIHSLADLDKLMDQYTEKAKETGNLVALKIAMAYARNLDFTNSSFTDADRVFTAILKRKNIDPKPLHDYLVHRIIHRARVFDLPVQIHTGYLSGNWGDIRRGDPAPLVPLFRKHKAVKFNVLHASWPYSDFPGAMAKQFPNVWIDLCWAWTMNPVQMERILDEWLSAVPNNKIFAFGADTRSPFAVVGYAHQARMHIANVMEKKISSGEYDLDTARFVVRRIMHENACEVFRM